MHIPDGFLDTRTAVAGAVLSVAGLGVALRAVRSRLEPARVPLLGLSAAFVFAAQMLNFPVAAGTSGHLLGGVLAAVLVGPAAAVVVMSTVLILQSLLFADGGLTALGANLFNMALVAPLVGWSVYRLVLRGAGSGLRERLVAAAFAAWVSTVAASVSCAAQLALSGTVPWGAVLPAMALIHMLIGAGEAVITALVLSGVARSRPELLEGSAAVAVRDVGAWVKLGLVVAAGLVVFVAPWASAWPDGLEKVAAQLGFEERATATAVTGPLADYGVAGWSPGLGTIVAGLTGTGCAFLLSWFLARHLTRGPGRLA